MTIEMRKNPFPEIFKPYFDWLTKYFGNLAEETKHHKISAGTMADKYLSDPNRQENVQSALPDFFRTIDEFWKSVYSEVEHEINRLPGITARFGGDIGPQLNDSVFERTGLYFDTIIVPDPLLRISKIPAEIAKIKDYYFLKYAIEQVIAKDTYLADTYPPIAVLTADPELAKDRRFDELNNLAKIDCVLLTNALYGQDFDNYQEVSDFFAKFASLQDAVKEITHPEIFFWIEDVPREPLAQLDAIIKRESLDWDIKKFIDTNKAGYLPFMFTGRMMQINDIIHRAYRQNSHPLIAAPVSFHWLTWKIQANVKSHKVILPEP